MRQILFSLFFFFVIDLSYAQFAKGDKIIGGTFSLGSQRAPNNPNGVTNEVNSFSIYPSISFLTSEKLAVGGQIGYSYYYSKSTNYQPSISEYESRSFSTGIFARRYYKITENFLFSINGLFQVSRDTEINTSSNTSLNTTTENKSQNYYLSTIISPVFIFFPSKKLGFSAGVGYISHSYSRNLTANTISNNFNLNYGTISLGLAYYI
jgi:hypothetical protein